MKRILILTAVLVFACSSDDSSDTNDNNNTSSERLIESYTLHSIQTCETYGTFNTANVTNCTYNNNNLITSFTSQFYEYSCFDGFIYYDEETFNYEYFDGYLVVSSNDGVNQFDLDENGNIDTHNVTQSGVTYLHNLTYENDYIVSLSGIDRYYEVQFTYENGNLISIYTEDENGDLDEVSITYTQYENKSKLFHPFYFDVLSYLPSQNVYGENNTNLPATYIRNSYSSDGELTNTDNKYYNYIFDDDGYVIFLEEGNYSTNYQDLNIINNLIEKTFEITYTN